MTDELATYPTLAAAQAATPATAPETILLLGYLNAGDGGRAYYRNYGQTPPPLTQGRFSLVAGGVTTWYLLDEQTPNELMFGAVAGASDAARTAAINNLMGFCRVITPCRKAMIVGSHTITSTITVYSGLVVEFACPYASTGAFLTKGFNGDMISLGASAKLIGCRLVGNGANFTGRGIVISSGTNQILVDPDIQGMEGPCLEFTVEGAGSRFKCLGGIMARQSTTAPAIVGPAVEAATTGFRHFFATHGLGQPLIDFKAGNYFTMVACAGGGFIFSPNSQRVLLTNCRVAAATTVLGNQHVFEGNAFGSTVTFASGSFGCRFSRTNLSAGVINAAAEVTNVIESPGSIPVLDPPSANPGTITGQASIYVDAADGDLKIRFADGVTKTIVTDAA